MATTTRPGKTSKPTQSKPSQESLTAPIETSRAIEIEGARTHNLKNVSCRFPHRQISVITGPSGSGKSSLAFDTLYAEGQRRFVESMSAYARQFLERLEKPDVDDIRYILPAIALEQKNRIKNARSTVGTLTETYDYLRLLFGAVGHTVCTQCHIPVEAYDAQAIAKALMSYDEGSKLIITIALPARSEHVWPLVQQGYHRLWLRDQLVDIPATASESVFSTWLTEQTTQAEEGQCYIVIDRWIVRHADADASTTGNAGLPKRLLESIDVGLKLGQQTAMLAVFDMANPSNQRRFLPSRVCGTCLTAYPSPEPFLFSFNNPLGACKDCEGYGKVIGLDLTKVIPNRYKTLAEGAVHPFTMPSNQDLQEALLSEAKKRKVPTNMPYEQLNEAQRAFVLEGTGEYEGVYGFFRWLESKAYKVHIRVMLAKYRGYYACPTCKGSRLTPAALSVRVMEATIHDVCQWPIHHVLSWLDSLDLTDAQRIATQRIRESLHGRLATLNQLGLGYLTLNRQSRTLSGGEAQRVHLTSSLGNALTETLYVLDEPTVGLHPRDTACLMESLKGLKTLGNTVVMVEHDPDMMLGADWIIDLGPCGGQEGGYTVYEGSQSGFWDCPTSSTAQCFKNPTWYHASETKAASKVKKAAKNQHAPEPLVIYQASGHNLKGIDVTIPTQQLVVITGVSGSGKSSLIEQTLYATIQQQKGLELTLESLPCDRIEGLEQFADVVMVDQAPPGRSQRSNPATYVKAYDDIRSLFANTRQAQALGITASQFSFNSAGGRCETCQGLGTVTVDMQFLADVSMPCPDCDGRRFLPSVLAVTLEGKTITDVLNLTVQEALEFFSFSSKVVKKLQPLADIGLGYLKLGQSTSTLSGGEAQRLKLAFHLAHQQQTKPTLFLFDEPTTGLHLGDVNTLVGVCRQLVNAGHTLIVVEHNLHFVAQADWIIDLGPDGGDEGGQVVLAGTVEDVMACKTSHTGHYLSELKAQISQSHA